MKSMTTVICLALFASLTQADNPTGTWKYATEINGQSFDVTIKLKLDGDKLTGTVNAANTESKIDDGKYKNGEVSFVVNRELNGNKFSIKYAGTIKGDTFKGKREMLRDGQTNTREFEAKRVKE